MKVLWRQYFPHSLTFHKFEMTGNTIYIHIGIYIYIYVKYIFGSVLT